MKWSLHHLLSIIWWKRFYGAGAQFHCKVIAAQIVVYLCIMLINAAQKIVIDNFHTINEY